jgi:hypothetical protein
MARIEKDMNDEKNIEIEKLQKENTELKEYINKLSQKREKNEKEY